MTPKGKIEKVLRQRFDVQALEISDDSSHHQGHIGWKPGGGTHFSIKIVSKEFDGKKLLERHRMVYDALQVELKTKVHALAIKALTPAEAKAA